MSSQRATAGLLEQLTKTLGPPVATPEFLSAGGGKLERARYRVFRWRCPACGGGWDDPELSWRPFVIDSDGKVWCEAPGCSEAELAAVLRDLRPDGTPQPSRGADPGVRNPLQPSEGCDVTLRAEDLVDVTAVAHTGSCNGTKPHEKPARTDLGNASLFAADHADQLRHVRVRRMWLSWDGTRWRRDATGDADRAAKRTIRRLLDEAVRIPDADERKRAVEWALRSQSEPRLRAMLALAVTEPEIALALDQLDGDPWLLACSNGTLDLKSPVMRAHDPKDLITLGTSIAYDPEATCPRWERFLEEIFAGDGELITFVQRFAGYCLTGDTREHVLTVLYGAGCNGKSTFIGVLQRVLGDLALTAAFETFVRQRDRGPRNDLARLHRARLVTAAESGEGRRLDEATVKEITGGGTIAVRYLYGEHFEYTPQFKLMLVTNHRPRVDGDDDAIWRRLRLIPFEQSFEGREDRSLSRKLQDEGPGILAWAVQGCLAWQRDGLGHAPAVTRATAEYRQDEDVLGAFLGERCVTAGEVATDAFRQAYDTYCRDIGDKPLPTNVLGKRLGKRGIRRERKSDGDRQHIYRGVTLK